MKPIVKISFHSITRFGLGTFFTLLFIFITGTGKAQWNTNTSVNLEISGLEVADMQSASHHRR